MISFLKPANWNEVYADKFFRGLKSRFRFHFLSQVEDENQITITFTMGKDKTIGNQISDYVNGFFDAMV